MSFWFTADTHASHANIIRYSNRPFVDTEEMDTVLADTINRHVKVNDTLYHLGIGLHGAEKIASKLFVKDFIVRTSI